MTAELFDRDLRHARLRDHLLRKSELRERDHEQQRHPQPRPMGVTSRPKTRALAAAQGSPTKPRRSCEARIVELCLDWRPRGELCRRVVRRLPPGHRPASKSAEGHFGRAGLSLLSGALLGWRSTKRCAPRRVASRRRRARRLFVTTHQCDARLASARPQARFPCGPRRQLRS